MSSPVLTSERFASVATDLASRDGRLADILEAHGMPHFWHRQPGFSTLVLFILEQQVSLASAQAAFVKLKERVGEVTPAALLELDDEEMRAVGFSRQKTTYGRALAVAVQSGDLDLDELGSLNDSSVRTRLMALPGIGPWTADVYLLSCLRRPDIWPVGDRALQVAAAESLDLADVPDQGDLDRIGERWRPWRSVAARLLWHGYLERRGRGETPA